MNGGSRCTDWPSATCWLASAEKVVERCETSPLRSLWRWARSVTRLLELTTNLVNLEVSRFSSANSSLLVAIAGFRYSQASWAFWPRPAYCEADPWKTFWRPLRVGPLSVLKSSSRSTMSVVLAGSDDAAVAGSRALWSGPQVEIDVAVGDPRQRRLPDGRVRALVKRREVVQAERQVGLAVAGQRDVRDRADGVTADLDLVAGDDLAGVVEDRVDLVARPAREQDDGDRHHDDAERRQRGHPADHR